MTSATRQAIASEYRRVFDLQRENQYNIGNTGASERREKIRLLRRAVEVDYRDAIRDACQKDLGKAPPETDLTEVFPITSEAKHTARHLRRWLKPQRVSTPLSLFGSSSWIKHEPKGVCLIISPWNFPFNLTFGPLISAIAAGNCVILKPSEMTPNCAKVMREIIGELFNENEVAVFEGGVDVSTALLELPFNHIFFTGAPSVGKIVMTAAAKHLASVTLELGGKSPTIVDESADIKNAARMIAWGKFGNNGQICIAPDYIFVHESKHDELAAMLGRQLVEFYGDEPETSESYARIVNHRHYDRIIGYIEDAVSKGAKLLAGGRGNREKHFIEPTLIEDVPVESELMANEIFGPVLPLFSYRNIDEAIGFIESRDKPLALYIYSRNNSNINRIIDNTRAGGTCINNNDVHFFNSNLPFGGVNNSGIGKSHGRFGFEAFSNPRGVLKQVLPSSLQLMMPPYTDFKRKLIELTVKWL
ncbi:MAG: aldehyde dehydrogenase family protein [Acidobacteria bacterium]|nr:aldehyde dehydrogenase family protein [Acidobacteriota bacterium]